MRKSLLITFLSIGITTGLRAQTIIADRPDQTESSSTIENGRLQVESGLLLLHTGDAPTQKHILSPTTLFRYGITPDFELRVVNQFESIKNNSETVTGFADLEVGTKIQLLKKSNSLSITSYLKYK